MGGDRDEIQICCDVIEVHVDVIRNITHDASVRPDTDSIIVRCREIIKEVSRIRRYM